MAEVMDRVIQATPRDVAVSGVAPRDVAVSGNVARDVSLGAAGSGSGLIDGWIRSGRSLVAAIDPPLAELEAAYRQHYLRADATQAALFIGFLIVPLFLLVATDYLLLGSSIAFGSALLLRLILGTFSTIVVLRLRRVTDPRDYDRLIGSWIVAAIVIMLLVNMSRPPTYIQPVMIYAVSVLAVFVIVPNQPWHRLLLAGLYLTSNAIMFATGRRVADPVTTNMIWAAVLLASIMGAAVASHCSRLRRQQFAARMELERVRDELAVMATVDGLTGVLNRRRFLEIAADELVRAHRYNRPLSIIAVDLDHFKDVNDRFGHATGDDVLATLARALQEQTRQQDVVGRIGGEEFAMILPETSIETTRDLAERIRAHVGAVKLAAGSVPLTVTASLGVAEVRPSDRAAEDALRRADEALYRAKRLGRDRVEIA
jgi:diguanylate cyclase (GGDEF)-like protein